MKSVPFLLGLLCVCSGATSTTTWPPPSSTYDCGSTWLTAINTDRDLISPGYPFVYPNNLWCTWNIEASDADHIVVVKVLSSSIEASEAGECVNDVITAYDGTKNASLNPIIKKWCGTETPTIRSTGRSMTLNFTTNHAVVDKGFKLRYHQKPAANTCGSITRSASSSVQYLTSPGYPNNYPYNLDCEWTILGQYDTVIKLAVLDAQLEGLLCNYDVIRVYDGFTTHGRLLGKFCGTDRPTFTSFSRVMLVTFHTDSLDVFRGFNMSYQSRQLDTTSTWSPPTSSSSPSICGPTYLTATQYISFLPSPGYPDNYGRDLNCHWTITAIIGYNIKLTVTDADIERDGAYCSFDPVKVYDGDSTFAPLLGTLCETQQPTYISSDIHITVVFKINANSVSRGFRLSYQSGNFREPASKDVNAYTPTGALIGGVFGGFVLLCCLCCVVMYLGWKRCKMQRPAHTNTRQLASAPQPSQQLYSIGGHRPAYYMNQSSTATSPYAPPPSYSQVLANDQLHLHEAPPPSYSTVVGHMSQLSLPVGQIGKNNHMSKQSPAAGNIHAVRGDVSEVGRQTECDGDRQDALPIHSTAAGGVVNVAGPDADASDEHSIHPAAELGNGYRVNAAGTDADI